MDRNEWESEIQNYNSKTELKDPFIKEKPATTGEESGTTGEESGENVGEDLSPRERIRSALKSITSTKLFSTFINRKQS